MIKAFRKNQGMLLAGAVAYYTLLSIVPLLILIVTRAVTLYRAGRAARDAGDARSNGSFPANRKLVEELASFVNNATLSASSLLVTMIFFSSLAFTVLENAISVIFLHRIVEGGDAQSFR